MEINYEAAEVKAAVDKEARLEIEYDELVDSELGTLIELAENGTGGLMETAILQRAIRVYAINNMANLKKGEMFDIPAILKHIYHVAEIELTNMWKEEIVGDEK